MVSTKRRTTSFRLPDYLLTGLKNEAKKQNKSMNSFVELLLLDALYDIPNEETRKAIQESKNGIFAGTVDTSSMDAFKQSLGL